MYGFPRREKNFTGHTDFANDRRERPSIASLRVCSFLQSAKIFCLPLRYACASLRGLPIIMQISVDIEGYTRIKLQVLLQMYQDHL